MYQNVRATLGVNQSCRL